jgi:hypothetical protein
MLKQPQNTPTAARRQAPKRARSTEMAVYDGATMVGVLRERRKRVEAIAITGNQHRRVGTFKTRREAMRAIPKPNGARPIRAEEDPVAV